MRVVVREGAYDDLERIYAWIARDEPRLADNVVERIVDNTARLGRFPRLGHAGKVAGTYEWVVPGLPYIIVYVADHEADVLDVLAIFHGAQSRDAGFGPKWRQSRG
jgi:plasmid stabilization system protein ParE